MAVATANTSLCLSNRDERNKRTTSFCNHNHILISSELSLSMASNHHNPQHAYEHTGFSSNNRGGYSNGGRGNGKRGRGSRPYNSNYNNGNGRPTHGNYQNSRNMSDASAVPGYPVDASSAWGVPGNGFSQPMNGMNNTPNAWPLPGAVVTGPTTGTYAQLHPATEHRMLQHKSSYDVLPPHVLQMANDHFGAPPQNIPSSYTPPTAANMTSESAVVNAIGLDTNTNGEAPSCAPMHAPTAVIMQSHVTAPTPASPVLISRSGQSVFTSTLAKPTDKSFTVSKNSASNKTLEETVHSLDNDTLAHLQKLCKTDNIELRQTLRDALGKRRAGQRELLEKRATIMTQLNHARESAQSNTHKTLVLYNTFVTKMTDSLYATSEVKETLQREAIEYLKTARVHSTQATKDREYVESCRDTLEATNLMMLNLTNKLTNSVYRVVVTALSRAVTSDVLIIPDNATTHDTAAPLDIVLASDTESMTAVTSTTNAETDGTEKMKTSDPTPDHAEMRVAEIITDSNLQLDDKKEDIQLEDDTKPPESSPKVTRLRVADQHSKPVHEDTNELDSPKPASENGWGNWFAHIRNDDKEMVKKARQDLDRIGGQTFRPELKETYKNQQGKTHQIVHEKVTGKVAVVVEKDSRSSVKQQVSLEESGKKDPAAEPTPMTQKTIETQSHSHGSEKDVITLNVASPEQVATPGFAEVAGVTALEQEDVANHDGPEEQKDDESVTTEKIEQPAASPGSPDLASVQALKTMIQVYMNEKTPKLEQEEQKNPTDTKSTDKEAQKNKTGKKASAKTNISTNHTGDKSPEQLAAQEQKAAAKRQKVKESKAKTKAKRKARAADKLEGTISSVKTEGNDGTAKTETATVSLPKSG
ncbi:hypothetical protein P153DRAFT_392632 [Dothidotthia symphoricarpi CBS 119687]|uniref:Uncharacterized protein n=1 Tax=Dothidotthia symphoricarpi CBS 119687 TaxID=1392245 RepID=A0A6A6AQD2_9PLEO|nr:uncharacterized protein P153DRAFT_392632 [Dothidotthia symphoricarpi CBS 119687]KAF2134010.1 hypothetical protein P153DRAFT_392632 [Dothidotthia symphoricarpi CBS 119687]